MGPVPQRPGALGAAPNIGFPNSQFPIVGPTSVYKTYSSKINTSEPMGESVRRTIAAVKTPKNYGTGAGDRSRNAFSRSMADTSRNALLRSADEFNVKYRSQAEQARAQDILSQRQNAHDRLRMESQKATFDADTVVRYEQGMEDILNRGHRARSAAQAQVTASILRMVGGLI